MLSAATQQFLDTVRSNSASEAQMQAAAQALGTAAGREGKAAANAALKQIAGVFTHENHARAGFASILCGALLEQGCDPETIAEPLLERLRVLLPAAVELLEACRKRLPPLDDEDQDPHELVERAREQLAASMPRQTAAWEALELFWRPAIVVLSKSVRARDAARPLREMAHSIADFHEAGHWLSKMLLVLENEPLLVIEPARNVGILGRMSGVAENFQLNVLLMDVFPKASFFSGRRVSAEAARIARGNGPQMSNETLAGVWNLYTWQAIDGSLKLPDPHAQAISDHWIWNEGVPGDIPVFEGQRVVLLGPRSYHRMWNSQRLFDHLPADVVVERKLTSDEVNSWLACMAAAKGG